MFARFGAGCAALAATAVLAAGCSSTPATPDGAAPSGGSGAGSGSGTPTTSPTSSAPALPAVCSDVLPLIDLDTALGVPLTGRTEQIQGVPEPKINRTGRVTCRYGVLTDPRTKKAGAPKIEVGISAYTDEAAATDRVQSTVVDLRGEGAVPHAVTANGLSANVLTQSGVATFVVATGNRTVVITLAPRVVPGSSFTRAAELARRAAEVAPLAGRPIAAANAALEWPSEPHLVLWQASAVLRESRGDGHVAALVGAGLSPCQALITSAAAGGPSKEVLQLNRRWSDEEWAAGEEDLRGRGLLDASGALTPAGVRLRQQVEDTTDALAEQGWRALGDDLADELHDAVRPLSSVVMSSGLLPADNPMGLRWD